MELLGYYILLSLAILSLNVNGRIIESITKSSEVKYGQLIKHNNITNNDAYERIQNGTNIEVCKTHDDCLNGGICNKNHVCNCKKGYEGDTCWKAVGCRDLKEPCERAGGRCIFTWGVGEIARCKCSDDGTMVYDEELQSCQDYCDENACRNGGTCHLNQTCICPENVNGRRCEIVLCRNMFQRCESTRGSCRYDEDSRVFYCRCSGTDFFDNTTESCKTHCYTFPCLNGGVCQEDGLCSCLEHTNGTRCELVDCDKIYRYCTTTGGICEYSEDLKGQMCKCPLRTVFHPFWQQCESVPNDDVYRPIPSLLQTQITQTRTQITQTRAQIVLISLLMVSLLGIGIFIFKIHQKMKSK